MPTTCGGPDHLANMALAHRRCNERAGTLSLFAKIRLRERMSGRASAAREGRRPDLFAEAGDG